MKNRVLKFIIIFAIAILFIGYGVYRQDYIEVFNKARLICLECIGIG